MEGSINIFGNDFEYDFLSAWIKFNRIKNNLSQESLCYGICSPSHLSYFENGKKKLNSDIITLLLSKMDITSIPLADNIGSIRKNLINFITELEYRNTSTAKQIFENLLSFEKLIETSPYIIEFQIYKLAYEIYVLNKDYSELKNTILSLDTIYTSLDDNLKYLFLLLSGRLKYKYVSHEEGISRLIEAKNIKETPWINYHLGFCYCYDRQPLRSMMLLNKSLESYHQNGQYVCAMYCNIYLGICYTDMRMFEESFTHLNAAYNAANHFKIDSVYSQASLHISNNYLYLSNYSDSILWASKCLDGYFKLLAVINCIQCYEKLGFENEYKELFSSYLVDSNKSSVFYNLLYFTYLRIEQPDDDKFLSESLKNILPYYKKINFDNICEIINKQLISYYESKRKYKEANKLYKELLAHS